MQKSKILITGANGEMGHGLIKTLYEQKQNDIVALDLNEIHNSISDFCCEKIIGNILDLNLLEKINSRYKFDTIYHLAALLSTKSEITPDLAHNINVGGTMNLLNLALKQGQSQKKQIKFFFPSSIAVYGLKNLEEKKYAGAVKETSYINPVTMYGCNKLYCEYLGNYYASHYCMIGSKKYKSYIDFRAIRFPGIISAKTIPTSGTSDYIPEMIHSLAKSKPYNCFVRKDTQIPFMTMPEATSAILKIMSSPKKNLNNIAYNIRSFAPTVDEFKKILVSYYPNSIINYNIEKKRQDMVDGWPMDTDDNIAKKEWGWKPIYNIETAISEYLIPRLKKLYS